MKHFIPNAARMLGLVAVLCMASFHTALADRAVRLSVKVIKDTSGNRPSGGVADAAGFAAEVAKGNQTLVAAGQGFWLVTVEFADIQPPVPNTQAGDYWYSLPARSNKSVIEAAAIADPTTWKWRTDSINIYVNNTSSGQCSFPPGSFAITLGKSINPGTVLHEIGHFFNLFHTHAGDYDQQVGPWTDGDGLPETLPDDPDVTTRAQIDAQYPGETQAKRDDLWFNVMSYHQEDRLLPVQMAK